MQYNVIWCNMIRYDAIRYDMIRYDMTHTHIYIYVYIYRYVMICFVYCMNAWFVDVMYLSYGRMTWLGHLQSKRSSSEASSPWLSKFPWAARFSMIFKQFQSAFTIIDICIQLYTYIYIYMYYMSILYIYIYICIPEISESERNDGVFS